MKKETQVVKGEKYLPATSEAFSQIYNPSELSRILSKVNTIEDALLIKTPSLGSVKRAYGEKKLEAYLKIWIIGFNQAINVKRPLNEPQIDEIAFLIGSQHPNITIADLNLIFKNAKLGNYGEIYDTLSMDKILGWFRTKDYPGKSRIT
jgi:hypothetical protein